MGTFLDHRRVPFSFYSPYNSSMRACLGFFGLCLCSFAQQFFDVTGRIDPPLQASVSLHATASAFATSALSDTAGSFHFSHIEPGIYTLVVFLPGRGESRSSIDVGPGTADDKARVGIVAHINESSLTPDPYAGKVSVRELSIPQKAVDESRAADKSLTSNDTASAVKHLEKAVRLAPGFSAAWNHLGTIAYKSGNYERAEKCFRKSLFADPQSFEPLVNLGGVLLNLKKLDEAWSYNVQAVQRRPNDALANVQLGMTYFEMGKADLALRHLNAARHLDPGHFSLPQLMVVEIYLRRKQNSEAADVLDEFLRYHPDWPAAPKMRETIVALRSSR